MSGRFQYEKTLKGNPNKITVNQHIIPSRHISEWSNGRKVVDIIDIASGQKITMPPSSPYFCAMRLWEQHTEARFLKDLEDSFQSQMALLKCNNTITQKMIVTKYYASLCARVKISSINRMVSQSRMHSVTMEGEKSALEKDELNVKNSVRICRTIPSPLSQHFDRIALGGLLYLAYFDYCNHLLEQDWILFESDGIALTLSDSFHNNYSESFHVLPITPRKALIAESTYHHLEKEKKLSAKFINSVMKKNAIKYYML